eukprot:CAMPEP_0197485692 /NCGR_PEP_ID=MMETSP1311-20131121/623_1 /TAXON_ID=464262 /ORGANISM="Genus nov. species nov., Strain RCC856" /LENGTH=105 /DNA_ID=CAMNT_0043028423 /DNA_START=566 /DNA_END=879 /DNA_ORIENTATION=-
MRAAAVAAVAAAVAGASLHGGPSGDHALEKGVNDLPLVHFLAHEVRPDGGHQLVLGGVRGHPLQLVVAPVPLQGGRLELVEVDVERVDLVAPTATVQVPRGRLAL